MYRNRGRNFMNSQHTEELSSIFAGALSEVIVKTTGFSIFIMPLDYETSLDEMTGFMNLNGKNQGLIFITAGVETMRLISSYMTGTKKEDITKSDMEDALGEIVNMTAGFAKLRFGYMEQSYTLSPPFVIQGNNMSITTKKRINIISRVLKNSDIMLKIKLIFY